MIWYAYVYLVETYDTYDTRVYLVEMYDDMMYSRRDLWYETYVYLVEIYVYSRRDYMRLMCILASSRRDFMWVCVFFYGGAWHYCVLVVGCRLNSQDPDTFL